MTSLHMKSYFPKHAASSSVADSETSRQESCSQPALRPDFKPGSVPLIYYVMLLNGPKVFLCTTMVPKLEVWTT